MCMVGEVTALNTDRVAQLLLGWYSLHYRPLPWRTDPTPYHVWVSEIMLQQTRIEAALPYYQRFISALPDVETLASTPEDRLLKLWEGLGYYSRARNLQKAAKVLVSEYGGQLPADYDRLLSLPGIGAYTAGAIASIAYSIPVPAVDGNVMRVLARLTDNHTDVLSTEGKRVFTNLAWKLIPEQAPGRFNQALMELGETVCVPGTPRCSQCPLQGECAAYKSGCTDQLPVRIKKVKRRIEHRAVALVRVENSPPAVLLHRRQVTGLLAGLWELPNTLDKDPLFSLPPEIAAMCMPVESLPTAKHLFSHIEWRLSGYVYSMPMVESLPDSYEIATLAELHTAFPLPGAFRAYTALFPRLLDEES